MLKTRRHELLWRYTVLRVIDALLRRAQRRPYYHLSGYMKRWWLFGGSHRSRDERQDTELSWKRTWLDAQVGRWLAARLHMILRSDNERHMHDHPFDFTTIILLGGYTEVLPKDQAQDPSLDDKGEIVCRWRGPGSVVRHKAGDRHRLVLPANAKYALTVFIMGPKRQSWGFYPPSGKVYWRDYLGLGEDVVNSNWPADDTA